MKLTRRRFVGGMCGGIAGSFVLPHLAPGTACGQELSLATPTWQTQMHTWWTVRKAERERQRKIDVDLGIIPDVDTPRPYLICGRLPSSRGTIEEQWRNVVFPLRPERGFVDGDFAVVIENEGNAASWNCCVHVMYLRTQGAEYKPYGDLVVRDHTIVSVLPGEAKEVTLHVRALIVLAAELVFRCFDPVLDVGPSTFILGDRWNSTSAEGEV
jgi:hypothetical protein